MSAPMTLCFAVIFTFTQFYGVHLNEDGDIAGVVQNTSDWVAVDEDEELGSDSDITQNEALSLEISLDEEEDKSDAKTVVDNITVEWRYSRAPTFMEVVTGKYGGGISDMELTLRSGIGFPDGFLRINKTNAKSKKITCIPRNITENETLEVQLVNSTSLLDKLGNKNDTHGHCTVVLFYAPWCEFCSRVAPHFNALARVFPQMEVLAIDAVHFSSLNTRFGTIAVPNILVFHNAKAVAKFNHTERVLENIITFVSNVTGLKPNVTVTVEEDDLIGPLSSVPEDEPDYLLILSWIFTIVFFCTVFAQSSFGQRMYHIVSNFGIEHNNHVD